MSDNPNVIIRRVAPEPQPPSRSVDFIPGGSRNGPGVRIEVGHPGAPRFWSVTFTENRGHWPACRWSDHKRSDIVALRDALTQLLNDNP